MLQENSPPDFGACVEMILSSNPMIFEEGFSLLVDCGYDHLHQHIDDLIKLTQIQADPFTRGKFVELLGYSKSEKAIPILKTELEHPNQLVREWAVRSLKRLPFEQAIEFARDYQMNHPEEWGEFPR